MQTSRITPTDFRLGSTGRRPIRTASLPAIHGALGIGTAQDCFQGLPTELSLRLGAYHLTADQAVIGWTRPISTSLVNEFRVGYEHDNSFAKQEPFGLTGGNLVPGVPNNPAFAGGVTMITFTNVNTFIGSPNFLPKFQKTQQWQFSDTLSWTHGKHQFKYGTDVHAPQTDNFQDVPGLRGALNFTNKFSCQRGSNNQCLS